MKTQNIIPWKQGITHRPLLLIAAAATCMSVSSCIAPYGTQSTYGGGYSNYQPGYRVVSLPGGYRSENISGNTYYYQNGTYYRRDSNGYFVTDAPRSSRYYSEYSRMHESGHRDHRYDQRYDRGDFIKNLPNGYRVVNYRGTTYYKSGERFYVRSSGGYSLVRRPY